MVRGALHLGAQKTYSLEGECHDRRNSFAIRQVR